MYMLIKKYFLVKIKKIIWNRIIWIMIKEIVFIENISGYDLVIGWYEDIY